jgi:AcrR family transcriptional regulator
MPWAVPLPASGAAAAQLSRGCGPMAYEVTKRIKGHDYRYVVESYRDPRTKRRKTKWTYLGALDGDGLRAPVVRARKHVTKDDVIAAVAKLLKFRDPEHVTVSVIAKEAGISRSTFYRYFPDERRVFNAALLKVCNDFLLSLPSLDNSVRTVAEARATFRRWCEARYSSIGRQRAILHAISHGYRGKMPIQFERSLLAVNALASLETFLKALQAAGIAAIPDATEMSRAISGSLVALSMIPRFVRPEHTYFVPEFEELHAMFERAIFPVS